MKVLHILSSNRYSGAENVACQIISLTQNDVESVYCSPDGEIKDALAEKGLSFLPLKKISMTEIRRAIRVVQPDVIHAHDMRACFFTSIVCGGIPLICHIHNNSFDSRKFTLKAFLFQFAANKASHIFWVSKTALSGYRYQKKFIEKSSVLVNVIDVTTIIKKIDQDQNTYEYDVIFLGRLTTPKNPIRLMDVFVKLRDLKPDICCVVVGTGEMEEQVKRYADDKGLKQNVSFLGFQSNPFKILQSSKVMIMTSLWEGTPMCALEAMSLGVPIVSTPTDGLADVVLSGITGYLTDDNDLLASSIITLLSDEELRNSMKKASVARAAELMDLNSYQSAILSVYRNSVK